MKALTIRQPWANAIAHQGKRVENRTWKLPAKHICARILIHAGAQPDREAMPPISADLYVYSAIVAVATLSDCHWSENGCCQPWGFADTYHWALTDVITLPEPLPAKGRLGLWTPDAALIAAVTEQVDLLGAGE